MKISATSALVLNWTEEGLWETPEASKYFRELDLSEGQPLLDLFSRDEHYMHLQAVSNRKYFMKQQVVRFLKSHGGGGPRRQVAILAAGQAPLSIEIASLFPSCRVFDVDRYLMRDKKARTPSHLGNIEFVEADITDLAGLEEGLVARGFDRRAPTIAVMEGIIYYLTPYRFRDIMRYLSGNNITLVGDFCLKPECVSAEHRKYPVEVFRKITEMIELEFVSFYSSEELVTDALLSGFRKVSVTGMQQIQRDRTGSEEPFTVPESGWLRTFHAGRE